MWATYVQNDGVSKTWACCSSLQDKIWAVVLNRAPAYLREDSAILLFMHVMWCEAQLVLRVHVHKLGQAYIPIKGRSKGGASANRPLPWLYIGLTAVVSRLASPFSAMFAQFYPVTS